MVFELKEQRNKVHARGIVKINSDYRNAGDSEEGRRKLNC